MSLTEVPAGRTLTCVPEKFDGEKEFDLWLRHYESCAVANQWTPELKLRFLPTFFKDRAFLIFDELPEQARATYESVCDVLRAQFSPPERKRVYMAEFSSRVQKLDEPAEDYARELSRLLARAMPHLSADSRESFVHEQFLLGLRDHIQERVIQANPDCLSAAVAVAKRCEAYLELRVRGNHSMPSVRAANSVGGDTTPTNQELATLLKTLTLQVETLSNTVLHYRDARNAAESFPPAGRLQPRSGRGHTEPQCI